MIENLYLKSFKLRKTILLFATLLIIFYPKCSLSMEIVEGSGKRNPLRTTVHSVTEDNFPTFLDKPKPREQLSETLKKNRIKVVDAMIEVHKQLKDPHSTQENLSVCLDHLEEALIKASQNNDNHAAYLYVCFLGDFCGSSVEHLNYSKQLNDTLIACGYPKAIERAVYGYFYGIHGYQQDVKESFIVNHTHWKTNKRAARCVLTGFAFGIYDYVKDPAKAKSINESLLLKGCVDAHKRKADGLDSQDYGYAKDLKAANEFVEDYAKQEKIWALKKKAIGLSKGKYGYRVNLTEAGTIYKNLYKQGYRFAIKGMIRCLLEGTEEIKKDPHAAYELARKELIMDFWEFNELIFRQHNLTKKG